MLPMQPTRRKQRRRATRLEIASVTYNWATCLFIAGMVYSQFFGVISSSLVKTFETELGHDPALGPYATGKTNDVPFADRLLACVSTKGGYTPAQLSELLQSPYSIEDSSTSSVSGYRVLERSSLTLDSGAIKAYSSVCRLAAETRDALANICHSLGYNTTRGDLRIVHGVDSDVTRVVVDSLPLLILPYWDNAPIARYVIPGEDGSACVLRLVGKYTNTKKSVALVRGMNRTVRETKTVEWLRAPGGHWRHGWYEDPTGMKWYSDIMTSTVGSSDLPPARYFNALNTSEFNCLLTSACADAVVLSQWGTKFKIESAVGWSTSVVVYNGTQFGLFRYEGTTVKTLRSVYDWQTALSNVSLSLLLFRWMAALVALHRGHLAGECALENTGICALSNSASFRLLPLLLLPRLFTTLCAIFSVGCAFQGQQLAFTETWFVIYPAVTEFTLFYYSLLNSLAKILRRRISDALFAPTIVALDLLHFYRHEVTRSSWLGIADGWVPTLVTSDRLVKLKLHHMFTTDIALRLDGNITRLFILKFVILGLSLVPLLLTRTLPVQQNIPKLLAGIEKTLAIRANNVAGLGRSKVYELDDGSPVDSRKVGVIQPSGRLAFSSYELVRLGYVVFGDRYLITMDDWDRIATLVCFQHFYHWWNHRVIVFELRERDGAIEMDTHAKLLRVDAPELRRISIWQISSRSLSC